MRRTFSSLPAARLKQLIYASRRIPHDILAKRTASVGNEVAGICFHVASAGHVGLHKCIPGGLQNIVPRSNIDKNQSESVLGHQSRQARVGSGRVHQSVDSAATCRLRLGMNYQEYLGFAFRFANDRKRKTLASTQSVFIPLSGPPLHGMPRWRNTGRTKG